MTGTKAMTTSHTVMTHGTTNETGGFIEWLVRMEVRTTGHQNATGKLQKTIVLRNRKTLQNLKLALTEVDSKSQQKYNAVVLLNK